MNDYSDLIFLMGAMIIFSLLSIQTSRLFQMDTQKQIEGEIEYNAVSIAQDQIDKLKWIKSKAAFNNFKSTFPKQINLSIEGDSLQYNATLNVKDISIPGSSVVNKKVTVSISNDFMQQGNTQSKSVKLQYVKSFDS